MRKIGKLALGALVIAGFAVPLATAADAAWAGHGPRGAGVAVGRGFGPGPRGFGGARFYGPRFGAAWRGGNWVHGWHGNRFGWWWTVGPAWYWYSAPVYPYPAYYDYGYGPYDDGLYDDGPTQRGYYPPPRAQRGPAPQQFWYYCDNPRGYYPYVADCADWRQVPAAPPPNVQTSQNDVSPYGGDANGAYGPPPDDYGPPEAGPPEDGPPDDGLPDDGPRQLQPPR